MWLDDGLAKMTETAEKTNVVTALENWFKPLAKLIQSHASTEHFDKSENDCSEIRSLVAFKRTSKCSNEDEPPAMSAGDPLTNRNQRSSGFFPVE